MDDDFERMVERAILDRKSGENEHFDTLRLILWQLEKHKEMMKDGGDSWIIFDDTMVAHWIRAIKAAAYDMLIVEGDRG